MTESNSGASVPTSEHDALRAHRRISSEELNNDSVSLYTELFEFCLKIMLQLEFCFMACISLGAQKSFLKL